jgi:acetylornithine deacetylase
MGRVLHRLEQLDRDLQARPAHHLMGTGSLHASVIEGGREWSSYPDSCVLRTERRTIAGETGDTFVREIEALLGGLRAEDPGFEASSALTFARPAYELPDRHPLVMAMIRAGETVGISARPVGMSFWTDAAILGQAGIPAVLFGPGGAGLHSVEEYVRVTDVIACRDALAALAVAYC